MNNVEILTKILESGGYTAFIYNDKTYYVNLVYDLKGNFLGFSFNDVEYKTINEMLDNAFIKNIPLRTAILNATDVYED